MANIPLGLPPHIFILVIAMGVSLMSALAYKYLTDQNLMKTIKDDQKQYQLQMKEHKDNPEKMLEIQKKIMPLTNKLMMQQFKPMLVTMIPFLLVFHWLKTVLGSTVVIPLSFHFPLSGLETGLGWLGTYILFSMVFTTIFRKILKVA